jgi:crossover junction endodeoxyribonuclease RuvC
MNMIIGIDPGMSGAVCFLYENGGIHAIKNMPTVDLGGKGKVRRRINIIQVSQWFQDYVGSENSRAFIEKAQSMKGQGVASMFGYGVSYGMMLGILAARNIPYTEVTPQAWKKVMMAGMDKSSKDASRARATQLWPTKFELFEKAKDEHRAEAALIAYYGQSQIGKE